MIIRFLDIVLAGFALLILAPLLIPIALLLRWTGERKVFYRQQRVGKDGKRFGLIKFATMLEASPHIGSGLITLKNDPRVLPVGRFLRRTKLNELPQILNVLKGDMSVIGPRPQAPQHFDVFPEDVKKHLIKVRPGLSGIGSIVFRDEETLLSAPGVDPHAVYRELIAPHKGELELWFIRNRGIKLYLLLIFLTLWVIFVPRSTVYRRLFDDLPDAPTALGHI
jgi:lipopolysaccharide/colanic/teichoic acid biosynthesis glycosyltransferase